MDAGCRLRCNSLGLGWMVVFSWMAFFPLCGQSNTQEQILTDANADHIVLNGTVRDFNDTHPDFEQYLGVNTPGCILSQLNSSRKPVLNPGSNHPTITSAQSFNQWYTDVTGINKSKSFEIVLQRETETATPIPYFRYENPSFFPIDNMLFGNQGRDHNYHFTYELHGQFTYTGPQDWSFVSDDDLFVFINNQLVVDLGGVHPRTEKTLSLSSLNLTKGKTYLVDIFFAERHTTESYLKMKVGRIEPTSDLNPIPLAVRSFSKLYYQTGEEIEIRIEIIQPAAASADGTVKEIAPAGWTISHISDGGMVYQNQVIWKNTGTLNTKKLTYRAVAPMNAQGEAKWSGTYAGEAIRGDQILKFASPSIDPFDGHVDIGDPGLAGGLIVIGKQWSVFGGGRNDNPDVDHFHYLYKKISGNFKITIKNPGLEVESESPTAKQNACMGIMARQSLNPNSSYIFLSINGQNRRLNLHWRNPLKSTAEWISETPVDRPSDAIDAIGMMRLGKYFVVGALNSAGYLIISHVQTIDLDEAIYIGIAATSNDVKTLATGTFNDPQIESLGALPETTPTFTAVPTKTPTIKPTVKPSRTPKPTATRTPKPTATRKPTSKPTPTPTSTPTPKPTQVPNDKFTIGGGSFNILLEGVFEVPIYIQNLPETKAITFDVLYQKNALIWGDGFSIENTLLSGWSSVDANLIAAGTIRVTAAAFSANPVKGSGVLIRLKFKVNSLVGFNASTTLTLDRLLDGVQKAQKLPIQLSYGMKGDVDANGKITARDAQLAFKISAGRIKPTVYETWAAEVTGDKQITAADAQLIFEASLGKVKLSETQTSAGIQPSAHKNRLFAIAGLLKVENVSGKPDSDITAPIQLTNSNEISAFTFDVIYDPAELKFLGIDKAGTLIENFGAADAFEISPGLIRVSAAAFSADPIHSSGILLKLQFHILMEAEGTTPLSIQSVQDDLEGVVVVDGRVIIDSQTTQTNPMLDEVILAQGLGGQNLVNIRNFDANVSPISSVLRAFCGMPALFLKTVGGGSGRATYVSTGDVDADGVPDLIISFGPVTSNSDLPNIVLPISGSNGAVIGHSFMAFPTGSGSKINYNWGEIRTAVGDFIGSGKPQIAAAQGYEGQGIVRLFQYTGKPAPNGWKVVGQFDGLVGAAQATNSYKGLTLAAGDLDNDGVDELVVGQTGSPSSQTIFQVLDLSAEGSVAARHPYSGFLPKFRGNGGIEIAVADLNGDGNQEIVAAGQADLHPLVSAINNVPINLLGVIKPMIQDSQITGFERVENGVVNVFSASVNPSGVMSIAAGELDGNPENGQELVVGTGSFVQEDNHIFTPVLPAPQSKYTLIKLLYDGSRLNGLKTVIGPKDGFNAFIGPLDPSSGAVFVGAANVK